MKHKVYTRWKMPKKRFKISTSVHRGSTLHVNELVVMVEEATAAAVVVAVVPGEMSVLLG